MELRRELAKLRQAAPAGEVGGDVDLAAGMPNLVDGGVAGVGVLELLVQPLHLQVVGAIAQEDLDRGVRVGAEVGAAALRERSEGEDGADDGEELQLRDRVAS